MNDFDSVFIAGRHAVQGYDILGIVVPDHQQVADLPVGVRRKAHADLHIIPEKLNHLNKFLR